MHLRHYLSFIFVAAATTILVWRPQSLRNEREREYAERHRQSEREREREERERERERVRTRKLIGERP